jgi:phosphonate transport system ATP-binding protein
MILFDKVELRFAGGVAALDGVTLEVPRGEFCVVLGPSGAGKSTLLRTVNGLATPTDGAVWLNGVRLTPKTLAALRPRIGMIHQQFNLVPRLDVATNVLTGALPAVPLWRALLGLFPADLQRRACDRLADVGLEEEHLARRADELSGGQQQRVGIARAFMLDPAVVLADEPVASLDPPAGRRVLGLLKRQARERNATVLCTLHQVELAREFADRIVGLADGRVVFDGPPAALDANAVLGIYGRPQPSAWAAPLAPVRREA